MACKFTIFIPTNKIFQGFLIFNFFEVEFSTCFANSAKKTIFAELNPQKSCYLWKSIFSDVLKHYNDEVMAHLCGDSLRQAG